MASKAAKAQRALLESDQAPSEVYTKDNSPLGNMNWNQIPAGSKVVDTGVSYVITTPDNKRYLAAWSGYEADHALMTLRRLAGGLPARNYRSRQRRPVPVEPIRHFERDIPPWRRQPDRYEN